jgi:putative serine protease PepD
MVTVAAAAGYEWRTQESTHRQLAAQEQAIEQLQAKVDAEPDWPAITARVEQSVVTIEAGDELGSGWVAGADARGSELVTNYHVVADAWTGGSATVDVRHGDRTMSGTIQRVDPNDDLALIHIAERLPTLVPVTSRPRVGSPVIAVGSPLGLDGTVTIGIVSSFRSLEGSDYLQFSAPVSPGNSGGPVIDGHGHVVAVTSAKLVYPGAEGLSLAIPVQVVCQNLVACTPAMAEAKASQG